MNKITWHWLQTAMLEEVGWLLLIFTTFLIRSKYLAPSPQKHHHHNTEFLHSETTRNFSTRGAAQFYKKSNRQFQSQQQESVAIL